MKQNRRILVVLVVLLAVLVATTACTPKVTPTAGTSPAPTTEATPTPDLGALFQADAKMAEATLLASLTLYQDFCKSTQSAWYDAISAGNDGLAAATAFVATDASKAKIAEFQKNVDDLTAKVDAWKSATVPDAYKDVPAKVDALLAALTAMKSYMTTPAGTMESYDTAFTKAYDDAKALYDQLVALVG